MDRMERNSRIIARGEELFRIFEGEKPSLFDSGRWVGAMTHWSLAHDEVRTGMLRFVDVFPALVSPRLLAGHLAEYFDPDDPALPAPLRFGVKTASGAGRFGAALLGKAIRMSIERMGTQFIVGDTMARTVRALTRIRRSGCAFSVDILGEAVLSGKEAESYKDRYLSLLDGLKKAERSWKPLDGQGTSLDWGHMPKISVSLKPSSLYSQARPQDFKGSVSGILAGLRPGYEKIIETGASLTIDMESYRLKDISLEVFRRLRKEYPDYPHLAMAMQAYLVSTEKDVSHLLDWSRAEGLPVAIRLVKGAYWDYEIMRAKQNGWHIPVYTRKAETDAAFERHARLILEHHDHAYLACGSHNLRSIAAVLESAEEIGVPPNRYEFQVLYGMAEPVRKALLKVSGRVRLYCPAGEIVPGMAYLVRRLLENTANQGFLRLMFAERTDLSQLLKDPCESLEEHGGAVVLEEAGNGGLSGHEGKPLLPPFKNQPATDFTEREDRDLFAGALVSVRRKLGGTCALFIAGKDRLTSDTLPDLNPALSTEVIAHVCQAGRPEAEEAMEAARLSFGEWRGMSCSGRADYLVRAAASLRQGRYEIAAWQVLEIGKQWDQAYADVTEAIDFLEFYAREMRRLGEPRRLPSPPGEVNYSVYEPRGVAVVIAPWNFPLAISCGMVAASLVAGNTVVYKPSPLTPVTGRLLMDAFRDAGIPSGVLNFVPGRTEMIAEYLIDHPAVSTIAFTGSTQTGLRIIEKAAVVHAGQEGVKRVICEMGGKNAIIIDEDADLDEAVPAVLVSAFGFQGQKCSSCSRVIVLASVYDAFADRMVEAARALTVGPPENPAFSVGPVADSAARERIMEYIKIAGQEGKILYSGVTPEGGNYVPLTIAGDIRPEHTIAQEEIFGPVLALMRVETFDEALNWANSTRFALTGGVFSRSPRHLEEAKRRFRVGNLYLNRHITGALVEKQPFGGFKLSGLGTKAGGTEYLLHFMDQKVITENTARRGFSPDVG